MSDTGENSSNHNGNAGSLQRLASFKTPRDLSLGGIKTNKKVFVPNLKAARNKNKSTDSSTTKDGKRDRGKSRHDHKNDKNRNNRYGTQVIKSSGVFSEGMGAGEKRQASRQSYNNRDKDSAAVMEKPVIRVKEAWKIDKELEDQKIKKAIGEDNYSGSENETEEVFTKDMPVRLPLTDAGSLLNKSRLVKEVVVKQEPSDVDDPAIPAVDVKPTVGKEVFQETDIVSVLRGDNTTMMLLQLPDTLPGRGSKKETNQPNTAKDQSNKEQTQEESSEERCHLSDLEEGRIGKLLVHRSGRIRLMLGDTTFDVFPGTRPSFLQEAVSVGCDEASKTANITSLGPLVHKLNLVPNWETLLKDL